MKEDPLYKEHRIHTTELRSGIWRAAVVNVGKRRMTSGDSLTDVVTRIPGEHDTQAQAIQIAKEHIDRQALDTRDTLLPFAHSCSHNGGCAIPESP